MVDIDGTFIGFVEIYYGLSKVIPKHFTIIDLGCAYNPQCFLFKDHKRYIAVDAFPKQERFQSENCEIYEMTIADFLDQHLHKFDLKQTFAICSYVPPWHDDNMALVSANFTNVFTYYPHGG